MKKYKVTVEGVNFLITVDTETTKHGFFTARRVTDKNRCAEVSLLPENNKRVRYLFDDEEHRPLSALTGPRGHLLPLVVLAIGTGMRRGDLFNLTWEKVDFTWAYLRAEFEDGKGLFGADERRR